MSPKTATVAKPGDSPKRRQSPKTATVAEFGDYRQKRRLSPKPATVAEVAENFGDCSRQCGQGFTKTELQQSSRERIKDVTSVAISF